MADVPFPFNYSFDVYGKKWEAEHYLYETSMTSPRPTKIKELIIILTLYNRNNLIKYQLPPNFVYIIQQSAFLLPPFTYMQLKY